MADIVVTIDSSNKDAWEVLNIDYADNNSVAYNEKKIQELINFTVAVIPFDRFSAVASG